MGSSAVHRGKQMFLIAPVSASGKNECRKLLQPLLLFALYFFPFKQQSLFLCLFFCRFLWLCFILWKEESWRRGKNGLYMQLARGDSNQSFASIIRQSQPKISQAGRSEGSGCKDEGPEAEESCRGKRTCCGWEPMGWTGALGRQACCHQQRGEAWTKPPLYGRNHLLLTWAGVRSSSPTSPSLSTGTAMTTAALAFEGPSAVGVSAGLQLSHAPLL